jgi:hypothetical protein
MSLGCVLQIAGCDALAGHEINLMYHDKLLLNGTKQK